MNTNTQPIHICKLQKEDLLKLKALICLFQDVFEMEEKERSPVERLQSLLNSSDFVAFAAFSGEELVGGATAYVLPKYYSESSELFLYDLAVKKSFQRQGIGKELMEHMITYGKKIGAPELFVAAHSEYKHAVKFYSDAGGKAEEVFHFTF